MKWAKCQYCGTLLELPEEDEPLNPYVASLGFKKTGKWYHHDCLMQKLRETDTEN